ncbi:MAG TPA: hypothetical protein PLK99_04850 [Burkholderiales bacterium]|nr:hypothetical protein [Burkholderiales bacterium]
MKREKGVVLVIALIALVAMSLAGISLMRSVDTANLISGNLAFDEAAVQMEDIGEEAAYNWIIGNAYSNTGSCQYTQANGSSNCPSYYYADVMSMDSNTKLPNPGSGNTLNWSPASTTGLPSGYSVQYIVERMCGTVVGGAQTNGAAPTFANCMASPVYDNTQAPPVAVPGTGRLFFRVTVRVNGPRNTTGQAQYFIGMEDNVT